jgi:hypothetical protein
VILSLEQTEQRSLGMVQMSVDHSTALETI